MNFIDKKCATAGLEKFARNFVKADSGNSDVIGGNIQALLGRIEIFLVILEKERGFADSPRPNNAHETRVKIDLGIKIALKSGVDGPDRFQMGFKKFFQHKLWNAGIANRKVQFTEFIRKRQVKFTTSPMPESMKKDPATPSPAF